MKKNKFYDSGQKKACLILILSLLLGLNLQAQFFSAHLKSKKRNPEIPTIIKSDSMDFDLSKSVAVFTGNVQVDDAEMQIFCHKMIINFEKSSTAKSAIEKNSAEKEASQNQSVKDIICLKNVIIIRKLSDEEGQKGKQKALAGKAVYDVKAGKITLTENPELKRGPDTLKGEKIMFWLDSERLIVYKNGQLQMRSKPNRGEE